MCRRGWRRAEGRRDGRWSERMRDGRSIAGGQQGYSYLRLHLWL